jgi:hypothetical protein
MSQAPSLQDARDRGRVGLLLAPGGLLPATNDPELFALGAASYATLVPAKRPIGAINRLSGAANRVEVASPRPR